MTAFKLAKADFLERIRRPNFLFTVCLTIILSYIFSPPRNGGYVTLVFDHYVGRYNSAWMGISVAISLTVFFSLIGFYLVANAIHIDQQTGVAPLIATTPVKNKTYLWSKFLSNWSILTIVMCISIFTALIMQLVRGEDRSIHLWNLVSPFLIMVFPLLALVASVAVIFGTLPWLQGTNGSVVYFTMWLIFLIPVMGVPPLYVGKYLILTDPFGQSIPLMSIVKSLKQQFPDYSGNFSNGLTLLEGPVQTFVWNGVDWPLGVIIGRILWIFVAFGMIGLISPFFHRFQLSKRKTEDEPKTSHSLGRTKRIIGRTLSFSQRLVGNKIPFLTIWITELKLILYSTKWWSLIITLLFCLFSFMLPLGLVEAFIWPLSWIWPLSMWSALGVKERQYQMEDMLHTMPNHQKKIFYGQWLAGITVSVLLSLGLAIRLFIQMEWLKLLIWLVGALFVPTLAITCGSWTKNRRAFEILYLLIWYIGPLNDFPIFNFMNLQSQNQLIIFSILTVFLFGWTWFGYKFNQGGNKQ